MIVEITVSGEGLITKLTTEWPFTGMDSHVTFYAFAVQN